MQLEKNLRCLDSLSCGCRVRDRACCGILTLVPWLQWFASAVLYKTLSSLDLCSQRAVCRIQMIVSLQGTRAHVCIYYQEAAMRCQNHMALFHAPLAHNKNTQCVADLIRPLRECVCVWLNKTTTAHIHAWSRITLGWLSLKAESGCLYLINNFNKIFIYKVLLVYSQIKNSSNLIYIVYLSVLIL